MGPACHPAVFLRGWEFQFPRHRNNPIDVAALARMLPSARTHPNAVNDSATVGAALDGPQDCNDEPADNGEEQLDLELLGQQLERASRRSGRRWAGSACFGGLTFATAGSTLLVKTAEAFVAGRDRREQAAGPRRRPIPGLFTVHSAGAAGTLRRRAECRGSGRPRAAQRAAALGGCGTGASGWGGRAADSRAVTSTHSAQCPGPAASDPDLPPVRRGAGAAPGPRGAQHGGIMFLLWALAFRTAPRARAGAPPGPAGHL